MAKKEEKKEEKKAKEPATPEQEAAAAKKKKIIIAAVGGLLVVGGGAFAALKMLGSSDKKTGDGTKSEHAESGEQTEINEHESESVDGGVEGHADGSHATKPAGSDAGKSGGQAKTDSSAKSDSSGKQGEKADPHAKSGSDQKAAGNSTTDGASSKDTAAGGGRPGRYSGIGLMYDMKPFHLNLGNPLENRYVRLEVRFEYPNEDQKAELTARDSQIRDAVVSIVSRKTREHLLSPDGKDQLRLEIKNRVNQYLEKKISNVYITDILIE